MGYAAINTWVEEVLTLANELLLCKHMAWISLLIHYIFSLSNPTYFRKRDEEKKRTGSTAQGIKGDTMKRKPWPLHLLRNKSASLPGWRELLPLCDALKS